MPLAKCERCGEVKGSYQMLKTAIQFLRHLLMYQPSCDQALRDQSDCDKWLKENRKFYGE